MSSDEATNNNITKDEALNMPLPRSRFSAEEDAKLVLLQQQQLDWNEISRQIGNRSPRQCRERFQNYLDPELNKSTWTPDEDNLLLKKESEMGKKWKKMMPYFQNRSNVNIKNRFTTLQNRIKANERQQKDGIHENSYKNMNLKTIKNKQFQKMMNWRAQSQQFQQMKQFQALQQSQLNTTQIAQNDQMPMPQYMPQMNMPMMGASQSYINQASSFIPAYSQNSFESFNGMQQNQQYQHEMELLQKKQHNNQEMQLSLYQPQKLQLKMTKQEEYPEELCNSDIELQNQANDTKLYKTNQFPQSQQQISPSNYNQNENDKIVNEVFNEDQEIQMMWNFFDGDDIDQKNNFLKFFE